MISLLDDMRAHGSSMVEFCNGTTRDGRAFHAFVRMDVDEYLRYQSDRLRGLPLNLPSYGEILHTGWGMDADQETRARILRDYPDTEKVQHEIAYQRKESVSQ